MTGAVRIARRAFVFGAVAVAGGALFGTWRYLTPYDNPLLGTLGPDEAALTPYVKVSAAGITLITPRAEMGQGIHTTLAALVAEELDVTLDAVRVEHGPASVAYLNAGAMLEFLPLATTDEGAAARAVRAFTDVPAKFIGYQITGGSSSVHDAFDKMRRAGATAREALKLAAAARLGVTMQQLRTDAGFVIGPDSQRIRYAALAGDLASVQLPLEPALKPRSQWRLLGRSQPRVDMRDKCTGAAVFAIDKRLPGMRFGAVRRSPHLGSALRAFDATAALAMPGVVRVVDIGDGIVAVADNTWRALKAAAAVRCEWAPPTYPADTAAHFHVVQQALDAPGHDSRLRHDGEVDAALAGDGVVEAEYRLPYLAHATMEPMSAAAQWLDGRLDIWTGTQAPTVARREAATAAGVDAGQVHIHTTLLGGGFGRRGEMDFVQVAAKVAKALAGTPVLVTYGREEDLRHDAYRPLAIGRARGSVRNGRVQALDIRTASPSILQGMGERGASPGPIPAVLPDLLIAQSTWDQPYAVAHYRATACRAKPLLPVGFWRSVGASQNSFMHECMLDELAASAGLDPLAMRLDLVSDPASRQVLEAVGAMSHWGSNPGPRRARGLAFALTFGVPVAEVVEIEDTGHGVKLRKVWVAADVGIALDPRNLDAQLMSAVVMGLSAAIGEQITVRDGRVEQSNFHDYLPLRLNQCPEIETRILENGAHIRGIGECGTPPAAPALANAIFKLTGQRLRQLPLRQHVDFV
jgi:isoquinoline 1-oxidoreductase subunit beta